MTSKERMIMTLSHKEPDKIPLDIGSAKTTGISYIAYKNFLKYKGWEKKDKEPKILDQVQQLALVHENVLKAIGVDTRGLIPSSPSNQKIEFKTDSGYIHFTDEWGIEWRMPEKGGHYFDMITHPLIEKTSLDVWPDPVDDSRMADFSSRILELKENGDQAILMHGVSAGIFELSLRLRGFEQFFMDIALSPSLACGILDKVVEIKCGFWEKALEKYGNEILVAVEADDLGTQNSLLISPDMYRQILKPRHKKLFSFIKKKAPHVKVFLHSCGAIMPLIPDLIETGIDILNPVQVSARGMEPLLLKKEFGDVLTFWGGGIDTQRILPNGTVQEVRDEVERRIHELAPGGGFVFNTVHNIQSDVPPENIEAMLGTFEKFKNYK